MLYNVSDLFGNVERRATNTQVTQQIHRLHNKYTGYTTNTQVTQQIHRLHNKYTGYTTNNQSKMSNGIGKKLSTYKGGSTTENRETY